MTTITVTKKGISATITSTATLGFGYYEDGNPWVYIPSGTASITSYTPAQTTIPVGGSPNLINGAVKNPRGHAVDGSGNSWQGVDQRGGALYPYTGTLTVSVPISCVANDVVVIAKSDPVSSSSHNARNGYISGLSTTRSVILEMMAITFVSTRPEVTAFRPTAFGLPANRQFFDYSQINLTALPKLIDRRVATSPTYEYLIQAFSDFCGEVMTSWNTDGITPDLQHPGYGQQIAGLVSAALCKTLEASSALDEPKRLQLIKKLIQWGIDLWGAFRDGRLNYSNGGHMQGRKALIIFAGLMLGDSNMVDPDTFINNTPSGFGLAGVFASTGLGHFQEGHAYAKRIDQDISIWYGGRWVHIYNDGGLTSGSLANLLKDNPSTGWPNLPLTSPGAYRTQFSYWGDETAGAQIGTALFMKAVKKHREWSRAGLGYITQLMQGFNNTIAADFTTYNLDLNGTAVVNGNRIMGSNSSNNGAYCSNLWRTYAFQDSFTTDSISKYFGVVQPVGPFLTCNDELLWGTNIVLEIMNAPGSSVATTELYFGDLQDPPTQLGGIDLYVSNQSVFGGAALISNPNSYGMLLFPVTLPSLPAGIQMQLTIQIVFTMTDGSKRATNAIQATLQ